MNSHTFLRNLFAVISVGLLVFPLGACSEVDRAEWTEQVGLATGEQVIIKRSAIRDKKGSPISRRGSIRGYEVTFPGSQITWSSDGGVRPIAVEVARGSAYLAADLHNRELCKKYANPLGSVVMFRWNGREWIQVTRSEYPQSARINLLQNPWGRTSAEDATGLIQLKDKRTRPGNYFTDVPLEQRVSDKASDACEIYKTL